MNSSLLRGDDDAISIFGDFDGLQEGFAHFFSVILALHSRSLFFSHAFFYVFVSWCGAYFLSLADVMCKQLIKFSGMVSTRIQAPDCLCIHKSFLAI